MKTSTTAQFRKFDGFWLIAAILAIGILGGCSGPGAEEEYRRALEYREQGDLRAASIELKNVLQEDPKHAKARYLLGEISLRMGDAATAEKELRSALATGIDEAAAQVLLAEALLRKQEYQKLLEETPIKDGYPAEIQANLLGLRATAEAGLGKWDQAADTAAAGETIDNNALWLLLSRVRLQIHHNDLQAAENTLARGLGSYPDNQDLLLTRAALLEEKGKSTEAVKVYQQVSDLDPPKLITAWGRKARLESARILLVQKRNDQVMEMLDPVLKIHPADTDANYLGALLAFEQQQYDLAQERVRNVLKVAPAHYAALLLIGNLSFINKDYEQAAHYLEKVTYAQPDNLRAQILLGRTYLSLGKYKDAEDAFELASSRMEGNAELLALIGIARIQGGDKEAGIKSLEKAAAADPDHAAVMDELARAYLNIGDTARAIEVLESAIAEKEPQYQTVHTLILAHFRAGNYDKAIGLARELSEQRPENPLPHVLMGMAMEDKKEFAAARAHYDNALELQAESIPAMLGHARIDVLEGEMDAARKRYQSVLAIEPANTVALTSLAFVVDQEGNVQNALQLLEKARTADRGALLARLVLSNHYMNRGEAGKALVYAEEAQTIGPGDVRVMLALGKAQLALGAPEAKQTFDTLVRRLPDFADGHFFLAQALARSGELGASRRSLQRVLQLDPEHAQAKLALGKLELHEGNTEEALQIARALQARIPDSAAGYLLEGDVMMAQKHLKPALAAYELSLDRTDKGEVVIRINSLQRSLGNPKAGYEALETWLEKHPNDQVVRLSLALSHMTDGQNEAAKTQLRKILEKQPDNAVVLNDLAWLMHESGEPGAAEMAEKAHRLAPENPAIQDTYGWILVQTGRVEQGLVALEQAAKKAPEIYDIRYHLAVALAKAGDKARAIQELESILNSGKIFSERNSANALLKQLEG